MHPGELAWHVDILEEAVVGFLFYFMKRVGICQNTDFSTSIGYCLE